MKIINWSSKKFGAIEILVDDEDYKKDAAKAWNEAARKYHGEFAYQNPL